MNIILQQATAGQRWPITTESRKWTTQEKYPHMLNTCLGPHVFNIWLTMLDIFPVYETKMILQQDALGKLMENKFRLN